MIKIISLFTLYHLVTSTPNKRLLQQVAQTEIYGAYNQKCTTPQSDFACKFAQQTLTDEGSGVLECGVQYSCCLCSAITCGSETKYCDTFKSGADYAAFGVQQINIIGEPNGNGAVIDCNGIYACGGTKMIGSWIDTVRCSADGACSNAVMDFIDSKGIVCGKSSCIGAIVTLKSNRGGELICGAQQACQSASITIDGILDVKCNGPQACKNTKIVVNDPSDQFKLDCNGDFSCGDLELTINVPGPENGCENFHGHNEPFLWKGINCGANDACAGMKLTVVNNGCRTVIIEDLQCSPGGACTGAVFNLNSGTGFGVQVKNCMCGPSCQQAVGLDACYNNVQLLDCPDISSCASQTQTIVNPGNDFLLRCSNIESCNLLKLNIIISGASQNLIQRFTGYSCSASMSCQHAVISIENQQINSNGKSVILSVNIIQCIADKACNGATFITGNNVKIEQVICTIGACDNCMIKYTPTSTGVPCAQYALTVPVIPTSPVVVDTQPPIGIQPVPILPSTTASSTTTTTSTTSTSTSTSTTASTTSVIAVPVNTVTYVNPNWVPIETTTTTTKSPIAPAIPNVNIPQFIPKNPQVIPTTTNNGNNPIEIPPIL